MYGYYGQMHCTLHSTPVYMKLYMAETSQNMRIIAHNSCLVRERSMDCELMLKAAEAANGSNRPLLYVVAAFVLDSVRW